MIAIDPGENPGFAVFDDESKELVECGVEIPEEHLGQHEHIVCERPMIYPRSPADPNRIISLAITAGRLVQRACGENSGVTWYLPREWKGQIRKTPRLKNYIIYKRVVATLNSFENKELQRALDKVTEKQGFDIVDAVGIGLVDLGRL